MFAFPMTSPNSRFSITTTAMWPGPVGVDDGEAASDGETAEAAAPKDVPEHAARRSAVRNLDVFRTSQGIARARSGAGGGPRDHDALDLGGPLEDRVDLGVPVPLLHREVLDVAVAAEDLDGLLGHRHRGLARLQLRHRAFGVIEGDVVA